MARTVYSSEKGRLCPTCSAPVDMCRCKQVRGRAPEGDGIARIRRETKGRRGKTVTTVTGIPLPEDELHDLAKDLKRRCGTGGACKDGVIEIQGDHRDVLRAELESRGFTVKLAGG
jgi:translation initiation factor 1